MAEIPAANTLRSILHQLHHCPYRHFCAYLESGWQPHQRVSGHSGSLQVMKNEETDMGSSSLLGFDTSR